MHNYRFDGIAKDKKEDNLVKPVNYRFDGIAKDKKEDNLVKPVNIRIEAIHQARTFLRIHKRIDTAREMMKSNERKLIDLHKEVKDFDTFNEYVRRHLRREADRGQLELL